MRHWAGVLAVLAVSACASDVAIESLEVGDRAPAVEGSRWIGLAPDLKNKVVLLDFWFSACPACVHAMPAVDQLAARYRRDGLVVVGPSLDGEAAVRQFRELHAVTYPFLAGAYAMAKAYNVQSFPFLVLIGKNGRVLWRANFKDETLVAAIEAALRG